MEKAEENSSENEKSDTGEQIQDNAENRIAFEPMNTSSNTLKRNPKSELSKADLLKLLTQFEGELQARDIVIAALKSEKVKQYLAQKRNQANEDGNDPFAALQRDSFATRSTDKMDICVRVNQQLNSLENLVTQQRRSQCRVIRMLKEAEYRHRREMELEKQSRRQFEREYLKLSDYFDYERSRHKQIVLFLLAERKKVMIKYIEERKRSEDLAQILAEEKCRVDAMAEGLEEESKKSLEMEAELEKQVAQFYIETQQLKLDLAKEQKRSEELQLELEKSRNDVALLERQLELCSNKMATTHSQHAVDQSIPSTMPINNVPCSMPSMMTSIAKVVQPTATVSSVPVSTPMTGVAKSVTPGQPHNLRYVMYTPVTVPVTHHVVSTIKLSNASHSVITTVASNVVYNNTTTTGLPAATISFQQLQQQLPHHYQQSQQQQYHHHHHQQQIQQLQNEKRICSSGSRIVAQPKVSTNSSTTGKQATGGASTNSVDVSHTLPTANNIQSSTITGTVRKLPLSAGKGLIGRGVPPPVPPNKPIVPPKKDGILTRKSEPVSTETIASIDGAKNVPAPAIAAVQRCNIPVAASRDKVISTSEKQLASKSSASQVKNDATTENSA